MEWIQRERLCLRTRARIDKVDRTCARDKAALIGPVARERNAAAGRNDAAAWCNGYIANVAERATSQQ